MFDKKFNADEIPEGATHYNQEFAFPFEKWESGKRYVYLMGNWDMLSNERKGTLPLTKSILSKLSH